MRCAHPLATAPLGDDSNPPDYLELYRLVLAQISCMVEAVGLQISGCMDLGEGSLGEDLLGHVLDGLTFDFMNEADVLVLTGGHARDDLAPGDLGIDDSLAAAAAVIDHHDEILHAAP